MRSKNRPSGRGRGGSFIEAARRAQIIEAAISTVADVGYAQASLAHIAERAGISKSVISYHFADKDELIEQVVAQVYGDSWTFMQPRLDAETTAAGRLSAYIRSELEYMESHRSQLLAVASIVLNHRADDGTLRFEAADESVIALLVEILRRGQRAGEFRDFDPRVLAVTISQAIDGALGQWAADPALDLSAYGRELIAVFELATRR